MSLTFNLVTTEDDKFVTVFIPGRDPLPAGSTHPNFDQIVSACVTVATGGEVDADEVADLFDVAATVERKFQRLSERVTVRGSQLLLDGDPVDGALQQQILDFLDAGEDFAPLVNFYEKLLTNPLGNIRDGLFTWIKGQRENGNFTITPDGDVLGYKAVAPQAADWRTDVEGDVFVPSRPSHNGGDQVNGIEVPAGKYIEQVPGDVVEMPRSKVLNEPSSQCGDGLHIGTYSYASGFMGARGTVMLVQFSPRDIVSLPDSNSSWKLRVCRYTVVEPVDAPLDVPVYQTGIGEEDEVVEHGSDDGVVWEKRAIADIEPGDRVRMTTDMAPAFAHQGPIVKGDEGTAIVVLGDLVEVRIDKFGDDSLTLPLYDDEIEVLAGTKPQVDLTFEDGQPDSFQEGDRVIDEDGDEGTIVVRQNVFGVEGPAIKYDDPQVSGDGYLLLYGNNPGGFASVTSRPHGKGGPTSQAAKGNGRNPAQDEKGRFSAGRPGSQRDPKTGRFAG